jgi:hypothetical protein
MGGTITAIVGHNGDGKTLAAVALYAAPAIAKGREVVGTVSILDPDTGQRMPGTRLLNGWRELLELENCLLILDEINSEFPSRGAMQLPPELMTIIHQLRKPKVDVVWTAVNWSRADVALREATRRVVTAKGFRGDHWQREQRVAPLWHPSGDRLLDPNGKPLRDDDEWPPNRLFRWQNYDATAFDEFTVHAIKSLKPAKRIWYWRPWHNHQFMYDTNERVPLLDNVSATGTCLTCGGQKQRVICKCGPAGGARAKALRSEATTHTEAA